MSVHTLFQQRAGNVRTVYNSSIAIQKIQIQYIEQERIITQPQLLSKSTNGQVFSFFVLLCLQTVLFNS